MSNRFAEWLKKRRHSKKYTYGCIINEDGSVRHRARMNNEDGRVQFVLWKAGEEGHKTDYWHNMGHGWESQFRDIKIMDEQQEDEKAKTATLEKKIENLELALECAKIDMENYKIGRELQNKVIDGLNSVIDEQRREIEKSKTHTGLRH